MKPEDRALLAVVIPLVVVVAFVGAYLLVTPSTPLTVVVPWGTVFQAPSTGAVFVFNVTPPGASLVGAWRSTGNTCALVFPWGLLIPHAVIENCIAHGVSSGTLNVDLTSSATSAKYTLTFSSDAFVTVTVTQTIQVVY